MLILFFGPRLEVKENEMPRKTWRVYPLLATLLLVVGLLAPALKLLQLDAIDGAQHSVVRQAPSSSLMSNVTLLDDFSAPTAAIDATVKESTRWLQACPDVRDAEPLPKQASRDLDTFFSQPNHLLQHLCSVRFNVSGGKVSSEQEQRSYRYAHKAFHESLRSSDRLRQALRCPELQLNAPRPKLQFNGSALDWRQCFKRFQPLMLAVVAHPVPQTLTQTTFERVPKSASWVVATNIGASCALLADNSKPFFMNKRHTCYFSLHGVGSHAPLKKLISYSRQGRNAIFKEREAAFMFGGMLKKGPVPGSRAYIAGTVIYLGAFEVDNVGHVIHDALWALQLTLLLNHIHKQAYLPTPVRLMFGADFDLISSDYFASLSIVIAEGERALGTISDIVLLPNELAKGSGKATQWEGGSTETIFLEKLVIPGQDRHVDGGGLGLRSIVANRIRRHVFSYLKIDWHHVGGSPEGDVQIVAAVRRLPRLFVYGRNDVRRRSVDNVQALYRSAVEVSRTLSLPELPVLIDTFSRPALDQALLMSSVDVFLAVQGSHLQNTLFMPSDGVIIEIAPCRAERVSFIQRYGRYLDNQRYVYLAMCDSVMVNYSDEDPVSQNVTICPEFGRKLTDVLLKMTSALKAKRNL